MMSVMSVRHEHFEVLFTSSWMPKNARFIDFCNAAGNAVASMHIQGGHLAWKTGDLTYSAMRVLPGEANSVSFDSGNSVDGKIRLEINGTPVERLATKLQRGEFVHSIRFHSISRMKLSYRRGLKFAPLSKKPKEPK